MKAYLKSIISMAITLCVLATFEGCSGDCKDVVKGTELADLLVKDISTALNEDIPDNPYYKVIHDIINSIEKISCPKEVADAGAHSDSLAMLYSSDKNFSNPSEVGTQQVSVTEVTPAGKTYSIESKVEFIKDGFYAIAYKLDDKGQVKERDESNNVGQESIVQGNGRTIVYNYSHADVFEVRNSKPQKGNAGYFKRWTVKVIQ